MPEKFHAIDEAIESNALLAEHILDAGLVLLDVSPDDQSWHGAAKSSDVDKARSTINQVYREWSAEGLPERHACFTPLLEALNSHLSSVPPAERHRYRVLVPGAGLGRLVFEICIAGYTVEGNELSYHQLLALTYILNHTEVADQHRLYPFVSNFNNHLYRSDQLRMVQVPDIYPAAELKADSLFLKSELYLSDRMSLTAGDFCSLYMQPKYQDSFDAILFCFFIDTATNVIRYIETVKHCLKPGGIWCNNGPLLWHSETRLDFAANEVGEKNSAVPASNFSNASFVEHGSVELTNEEVIALIEVHGFEMLEQKEAPMGASGYVQDPYSSLQHVYRTSSWIAKNVS